VAKRPSFFSAARRSRALSIVVRSSGLLAGSFFLSSPDITDPPDGLVHCGHRLMPATICGYRREGSAAVPSALPASPIPATPGRWDHCPRHPWCIG